MRAAGSGSRESLFEGRKWPRFSGSDSPRLPNQSELGGTSSKSTVFEASNNVLVGFMALLVAVELVGHCRTTVPRGHKSSTLSLTAIELGHSYRNRVAKPESRGAGANFDVF